MTARETATTLAEMTGGFERRRDAIEAALTDAYRRGRENMRDAIIRNLPPRSPNEQETET